MFLMPIELGILLNYNPKEIEKLRGFLITPV